MSSDDAAPPTPAAIKQSKGRLKNSRKQRFAAAVARGENATVAAREAGYSGSSEVLSRTGSRLVRDDRVREAVAELRAPEVEHDLLSAHARQVLLARIVAGEVQDVSLSFGVEVRHTPNLTARIRAAELLARMRGELKDVKQPTAVQYVVHLPPSPASSEQWATEVAAEAAPLEQERSAPER